MTSATTACGSRLTLHTLRPSGETIQTFPSSSGPSISNREDDGDAPERVWFDEDSDVWQTDFPPPPGFTGIERRTYGAFGYQRDLTPEEEAVVKADHQAELAEQRTTEDKEREAYFFGEKPTPYPLPPAGGEEPRSGEGVAPLSRDEPPP